MCIWSYDFILSPRTMQVICLYNLINQLFFKKKKAPLEEKELYWMSFEMWIFYKKNNKKIRNYNVKM